MAAKKWIVRTAIPGDVFIVDSKHTVSFEGIEVSSEKAARELVAFGEHNGARLYAVEGSTNTEGGSA